DIKTSLLAGSTFNVTWHLAYPHRGGFKLQVLDPRNRPLIDLTPVINGNEFVDTDATAQRYTVELPTNFTCTDCTIRLLRQAKEWGKDYTFYSCADVDIVEKKNYKEDCSGNGNFVQRRRCACNRLYHGARCQYKEECLDDADCGTQGVCIDNGGTTSPKKQCYCNIGWFGDKCSQRSVMKNADLDLESYSMRRFSDDFVFYWRILHDTREFEGVAVVNGTSWVGVGWRPTKHEVTPAPDDVAVQTSVTYKVSAKQGRKRRSALPEPHPTGESYTFAHIEPLRTRLECS
ncbi:hypothetical protein QAD02_014646, partial [Eretmocerus hayati]